MYYIYRHTHTHMLLHKHAFLKCQKRARWYQLGFTKMAKHAEDLVISVNLPTVKWWNRASRAGPLHGCWERAWEKLGRSHVPHLSHGPSIPTKAALLILRRQPWPTFTKTGSCKLDNMLRTERGAHPAPPEVSLRSSRGLVWRGRPGGGAG